MITYYFNNLHPQEFQRLVNALLVCKFGEDIRLTPLKGKDGGRDGETAAGNPYFPAILNVPPSKKVGPLDTPRGGRYLFQVKHHNTNDTRATDSRNAVVSDFKSELENNVITRTGEESVNYFLLLTNVSSSPTALNKVDKVRREIQQEYPHLHADVWWSEHMTALLDIYPKAWRAFPGLFAGNVVPMLAAISDGTTEDEGTPEAIRLALGKHFRRDSQVKFQQIDLKNDIFKLFVDLEVSVVGSPSLKKDFISDYITGSTLAFESTGNDFISDTASYDLESLDIDELSAVNSLLVEPKKGGSRLIVEGGPGQGKSTVTQVVAQIHRSCLLDRPISNNTLPQPQKVRVPFRIELRHLAEWISSTEGSLEQYICDQITHDSGGNQITVKDFHQFSKEVRLLLIFDGLDEIGSDDLKEKCVALIEDGLERLVEELNSDIQVIITTRPPAFTSFEERFSNFLRLRVQPMEESTIEIYVSQWLKVQGVEEDIVEKIGRTFAVRSQEPHVHALSRNPMQLSVLLHFIRLKGEAFPSKRAELYREYFKVVIDRDVAKTPELAGRRDIIELLHEFLGYKIHALSEAEKTDGSISYDYLVELVNNWLKYSGEEHEDASGLLKMGEERLGLLVATKGEGASTHYGFEIQPIREYFAAAYISNQSSGDAHKCFEELVVRPFWREVSLFLAGLRRNNEKADLICRLLSVDEQYEKSLVRPGIGILISLTEEGVFDQPPHLFNNAIEALLVAVDPDDHLVCALSSDFFERLSNIIKSRRSPKIIANIRNIRNKSIQSADDSEVILACSLASKLLQEDDTKKFIKELPEFHPKTLSLLKLQPVMSEIDITDLTGNPSFWEGVDEEIWISNLWLFKDQHDQVERFKLPDHFPPVLLARYATDFSSGMAFIRRRRLMSKIKVGFSNEIHICWLLLTLTELMESIAYSVYLSIEREGDTVLAFLNDIYNGEVTILFTGLDPSLIEICKKLVKLKCSLIHGAISGESIDFRLELIRSERNWLNETIQLSGVNSLIIARSIRPCLLLAYFEKNEGDYFARRNREQWHKNIQESIGQDADMNSLVRSAGAFYTESYSGGEKDPIKAILGFGMAVIPVNCRLTGSKELISISQAKFDIRFDEQHPDFRWLKTVPLNSIAIKNLVKGKKETLLADALAFIGTSNLDYRVMFALNRVTSEKQWSLGSRFHQTATEFRDRPGVPTGYLLSLLASNSLGEADYDLLKAGVEERYDLHRRPPFDLLSRGRRETAQSDAVLENLTRLAQDIIAEPQWPISVARRAALFLARDESSELRPLIEKEKELGL